MPRGFYDRAYLASGYDNEANMQPIYRLGIDPSCGEYFFKDYQDQFAITFRFNQNEGTQITGSRQQIPIGLPNAEWEFPIMSNDEFNFLADTFASNRLDGLVTVRTYDFENNIWSNFNAIMNLNQQERATAWNGFEWRPFIIQFHDMRAL